MHYVYVLKSLKFDRMYIGYTSNIKRRILQHNYGNVSSTKYYRPYKLVHLEEFNDQKFALKREKTLKQSFGREWLKKKYGPVAQW